MLRESLLRGRDVLYLDVCPAGLGVVLTMQSIVGEKRLEEKAIRLDRLTQFHRLVS